MRNLYEGVGKLSRLEQVDELVARLDGPGRRALYLRVNIDDHLGFEILVRELKDVVHLIDLETAEFLLASRLESHYHDALLGLAVIRLFADKDSEINNGNHVTMVVDNPLYERLGQRHPGGCAILKNMSYGLGLEGEVLTANLERGDRLNFIHGYAFWASPAWAAKAAFLRKRNWLK